MGEAKRRGTYEERKAIGVAKRAALEDARRERLAAREAAMTPEEKIAWAKLELTLRIIGASAVRRGW